MSSAITILVSIIVFLCFVCFVMACIGLYEALREKDVQAEELSQAQAEMEYLKALVKNLRSKLKKLSNDQYMMDYQTSCMEVYHQMPENVKKALEKSDDNYYLSYQQGIYPKFNKTTESSSNIGIDMSWLD